MPEPHARIYELALRSLDEQERSLDELRSRLALVVATAGIGATLLTKPAFTASNPDGWLAIGAIIVGLVGAAVVVAATTYLLISRPLAFSFKGDEALDIAENIEVPAGAKGAGIPLIDDEEEWHLHMTVALSDRHAGNEPIIDRLHQAFSLAVGGLIVELAGFGVAAAVA